MSPLVKKVTQRTFGSQSYKMEEYRLFAKGTSERRPKVLKKYIAGPNSLCGTDVFSQDSRGAEVFALPNLRY